MLVASILSTFCGGGCLRTASLLLADDAVLLASSVDDLERPLETVTAAGMKVSTS